jgi:hypothetical protein
MAINDTNSGIDQNVLAQAWFKNKLNFDKEFFALCGIDTVFLVYLMFSIKNMTPLIFILFFIAGVSFLFALSICISIYRCNSSLIEQMIAAEGKEAGENKLLLALDKLVVPLFLIGNSCILFIGFFNCLLHIKI